MGKIIQGESTAEECCLGDGQSYIMMGASSCQQCIGKEMCCTMVEAGLGKNRDSMLDIAVDIGR